jgi:hypothetical protein
MEHFLPFYSTDLLQNGRDWGFNPSLLNLQFPLFGVRWTHVSRVVRIHLHLLKVRGHGSFDVLGTLIYIGLAREIRLSTTRARKCLRT